MLHQVASELGLASEIHFDALAARREGFQGIHLGTHHLTVGTMLDVLTRHPWLNPPRTGHIGNWEEIAKGRAGPMDFNKAVCARGYGYPLVYCFTQTETDVPQGGDWSYLPGSLVERGVRTPLSLHTWDGKQLARRSRDQSYFCPFVQAEVDGSLQPLVELHWQRMRSLPRFQFELEQKTLFDHRDELKPLLAELLEWASRSHNPRQVFQDIIGHAASTDGRTDRCELRREGQGYWLNDFYYSSTAELVEHAMSPLEAVAQPRAFFEKIGDLPRLLPVISNVAARHFSAHFNRQGDHPINLSLQWGARDMAGFPPRRRGYFISKRRYYQVLADALVATSGAFTPICSVLLPAPIFLLCPSSAHPRDAELLGELFARVPPAVPRTQTRAMNVLESGPVEQAVWKWKTERGGALSEYFRSRFLPGSGVLTPDAPAESEPVEPDGFRSLTLQQACIIVGAFTEAEASSADDHGTQ